MKNKFFWIGLSGLIFCRLIYYYNSLTQIDLYCEPNDYCPDKGVPDWLYYKLEFLNLFFLMFLFLGILDLIIMRYKINIKLEKIIKRLIVAIFVIFFISKILI